MPRVAVVLEEGEGVSLVVMLAVAAVLEPAKVVVALSLVTMVALSAMKLSWNSRLPLSLVVRWAVPPLVRPVKVVVALSLVTMAALFALLWPRNRMAASSLAVIDVTPVVSAFATVSPPLPLATTAPPKEG